MNKVVDVRTDIKTELKDLEEQISSIKKQGPFLQGVRVERTAAGGTASRKAQGECKYARLRAGKGRLLDNGKKSKYIPVNKIDKYQAMCNRGKTISRLERKLQSSHKKLARLEAIAAKLGFS